MTGNFLLFVLALNIMTIAELDSHLIIATGILCGAYLIAYAIENTKK